MARVLMASPSVLTSACRQRWWISSGSATVTTHHVAIPPSPHCTCPGTCQSVHTPCQGACPDSLTPCAGGSACVDTATDLQYYDCAGDCLHVFQPCNGVWSRDTCGGSHVYKTHNVIIPSCCRQLPPHHVAVRGRVCGPGQHHRGRVRRHVSERGAAVWRHLRPGEVRDRHIISDYFR